MKRVYIDYTSRDYDDISLVTNVTYYDRYIVIEHINSPASLDQTIIPISDRIAQINIYENNPEEDEEQKSLLITSIIENSRKDSIDDFVKYIDDVTKKVNELVEKLTGEKENDKN